MPTNFVRSTRQQILARVISDIEGEVDGVSAQVRRRTEFGHAVAITGVADSLHGHLAWIAEQVIVDQASERFLLRWADFFGIWRKPPTPAKGSILVTGTGGTLAAGAQWIRIADGWTFATDAAATGVTSADVAITAAGGFEGGAGNLLAGTKLQLVSPTAGITGEATVQAPGLLGGTEQEPIAGLLTRLLDRIRRPPLGGAPGDHVAWALEVPGVTRAWEYGGRNGLGNPGIGKVALTFVCDGETDIIPTESQVADVQAYLEARSPAEVIVFAPIPIPFDWHVNPSPLVGDVEDAITKEVQDFLRRESEPGGKIFLSRFEEAVSAAAGELSHETISPTDDIEYAFGEIAVVGTATYGEPA
jgi:uncharacterized phage protein gp47/JayE